MTLAEIDRSAGQASLGMPHIDIEPLWETELHADEIATRRQGVPAPDHAAVGNTPDPFRRSHSLSKEDHDPFPPEHS